MSDELPLHNKAGLLGWDGSAWVNVAVDADGIIQTSGSGGGGGGGVTVADAADVAQGGIGDAAVGDAPGTLNAHLREIAKVLEDVWDSGAQALQMTTQGLTIPVIGSVDHDSVDADGPVKMGFVAKTAAPTAVAANDRVNGIADLWGRQYVRHGAQAPVASTFTQSHVPATNTQATKTQASAGSGKRNVCTGFTFTIAAGASAPTAAAPISIAIIDGAAGGTTYLWRSIINIPATAAAVVAFSRSNLWLVGTQATALTLEFSAAGGANTYESVTMDGVIIEE